MNYAWDFVRNYLGLNQYWKTKVSLLTLTMPELIWNQIKASTC